jgi:hypothetical protein
MAWIDASLEGDRKVHKKQLPSCPAYDP